MKIQLIRTISLALLLSAASGAIFAQDYYFETKKSRTAMTASFGANYARIANVEDKSEITGLWGFNAGMGFVGVLNKRGTAMLMIDGVFSMQGTKLTGAVNDLDPEIMKLNYINFPVVLRYHPFKKFHSFYVGAGPQLGLHVGGHVLSKDGTKLEFKEGYVTKTVYDGVAVTGFMFGYNLDGAFELRYQHGFSKILKDTDFTHSVFQARIIFPFDFLHLLAQ